jgi:hypothetical protein
MGKQSKGLTTTTPAAQTRRHRRTNAEYQRGDRAHRPARAATGSRSVVTRLFAVSGWTRAAGHPPSAQVTRHATSTSRRHAEQARHQGHRHPIAASPTPSSAETRFRRQRSTPRTRSGREPSTPTMKLILGDGHVHRRLAHGPRSSSRKRCCAGSARDLGDLRRARHPSSSRSLRAAAKWVV